MKMTSRAIALGGWFILGCQIVTFLGWLAVEVPLYRIYIVGLMIMAGVLATLAIALDDPIMGRLKVNATNYYGFIVAVGAIFAVGWGMVLWLVI